MNKFFQIVIIMIVKNESHSVHSTLKPLIDAGIKSYYILDTGSTDDTYQILKNMFADNPYAKIDQIDFSYLEHIDFSLMRNTVMDLCRNYFINANYMLMIDADWILHNVSDLISFCGLHYNDECNYHKILVNKTK